MFSKDLEFTIGQCYKQAREARHEFMTVEHLLLALVDNASALQVLKACGADPVRLSAFAAAAAEVLNPAMNGFNRGVRAYYFALAAGVWLIHPVLLAVGAVLALALLAWRQAVSPAALGVRHAMAVLSGENFNSR